MQRYATYPTSLAAFKVRIDAAYHVTAEVGGCRYLLSITDRYDTAETKAREYKQQFPDARLYIGDKWDSTAVHGTLRHLKDLQCQNA